MLDQVPRNLYRGSAHAFATDSLALSLARAAVTEGRDTEVPAELRVIFYLPFEHSEALADQDRCLALCQALDASSASEWNKRAGLHRDIIVRFNRFPCRNAMLGRDGTAEELDFLAAGGFAG